MIEVKNTGKPDERRDFPRGHLDVLDLTGLNFGVATFDVGWRWSESLRELAGTDSCQTHHNGYVLQGHLRIRMDDGEEADVGPGDVFVIPPGHVRTVRARTDNPQTPLLITSRVMRMSMTTTERSSVSRGPPT
jgi:mannose-6-phosphate isomerase-like protein (cupin superfamily)